jgi:bifunctional non-homologous end joining protein LigD
MSKPLAVYNAKRDFRKTAEPKGTRAKRAGNSFVIQKHAASRLHYDFRLELDGVLKSWAVARGPSLVPGEKRLAVHVEDHPLAYGGFEGTIPQGEYGGGTVMLWDRGTWEPEGDARKDYEKGRLTFTLEGEKLHGAWHLVRMRSRPGERRENWLLIKSEDAWTRPEDAPDILDEEPLSVATGRTMDEIAAGALLGAKVWSSNRKAKPKAAPAQREPATGRPRRKTARAG